VIEGLSRSAEEGIRAAVELGLLDEGGKRPKARRELDELEGKLARLGIKAPWVDPDARPPGAEAPRLSLGSQLKLTGVVQSPRRGPHPPPRHRRGPVHFGGLRCR
jgi:hypothetical protein